MPIIHQKHVALKGSLLIFFLLISLHITVGQDFISGDIPPKLKMKDRENIWDKLQIPAFKADTVCTITVFSFKVTAEGTIDSVFVKGDCPIIVKESLVKHIKSTSGSWEPRILAGKPIESKLFVLPYVFLGVFALNNSEQKLLENVLLDFTGLVDLLTVNQEFSNNGDKLKEGKLFVETKTKYLFPSQTCIIGR